ncbi:MAG: epsilon-lactone hydrolase, partial [Subtercola sp.]|nr:epsilon-lactone hydrolase [Subtercola sp.]
MSILMAATRLLLRTRPVGTKDAATVLDRLADRQPAAPIPRAIHRLATVRELSVEGRRVVQLTSRTGASGAHLIYTHGGAYVYPLVAPHWQIIAALIASSGAVVTVPFYGLAPEHHVEEAYTLLDAVYAAAVSTHGDRVFLAGDSAGGALALGQAIRYRDAGLTAPAAVILFSPWLDISLSNPGIPAAAKLDPMLARDGLVAAGQWWADETDPRSPLLSPLFADLGDLPPVFVYQGARDLLAPDAKVLAGNVAAVGGRIELRLYSAAFHVFVGAPWTPEARRALRHAGSVLRGEAAPVDRKLRVMTASGVPAASPSPAPGSLLALTGESFASLTTFRKTGVPVSTPVWVARDGDALLVVTPSESGKVKRLRNNTRVELRPCDRRGRVAEGAVTVTGEAGIVGDPAEVERLTGMFRAKYGFEYRVV